MHIIDNLDEMIMMLIKEFLQSVEGRSSHLCQTVDKETFRSGFNIIILLQSSTKNISLLSPILGGCLLRYSLELSTD